MENEYREIMTRSGVRIKLPNRPRLRQVEAHSLNLNGKTLGIPKHLTDGLLVEGIIVNRHFYGFSRYDFPDSGKERMATVTVKVVEKTLHDRRIFTMLDFYKEKETSPAYELKLSTEGDASVVGTNTFIKFIPLG